MVRACLFIILSLTSFMAFCQQFTDSVGVTKSQLTTIPVSEDFKNKSLETILITLQENYSVSFSYVNDFIPLKTKISVKAKNVPLESFLLKLFENIPISFLIVGDQIVLLKKDDFGYIKNGADSLEKFGADTVLVSFLESNNPENPKRRVRKKISLFDLLNGDLFFYESNKLPPPDYNISNDSLNAVNDSLLARERRLRRARVRLIKSQNWAKKSVFLFFQPELTNWVLKGTAKQSIDYKRYNDYNLPDLSLSLLIGTSYRFYRSMFFRPALLASVFSRKGVHTNYLVSVFNPTIAQPVSYSYSSTYGYLSLSAQIGYENKFKKGKIVAAVGYFYGFLLAKAAPDYFPYYETKYYSSGTIFYNNDLEVLKPEKIPYRDFIPGIIGDILICRSVMENFEFVAGISAKFMLRSIYLKTAPVAERAFTVGLTVGLRYNL